MSAYITTRFALTSLALGVASLSGCGWRVHTIAPDQLNGEIAHGGIVLPAGTTALEGRWRRSLSHGSGLLLKLGMTPAAYREFRDNAKFKPVSSSRRSSDEEMLAVLAPVLRLTWDIKRGRGQVLESGHGDGTDFAALVEEGGAATVYLSQFY
jgi:hypothetical protein